MADNKIQIILTAVDRTRAAFDGLNRNVDAAKTTARSAITDIKKDWLMATAKIAGAYLLLRQAWNVAEQSAQYDQSHQAFRSMAQSMGADAEATFSRVRQLSGNLIDDKSLTESMNKALSLGIPIEKLGDLMLIARAKGRDMGLTTTQAFNDIATGIGRASPMILDNLGLTLKVGSANDAMARSLGKSADELTDNEKKLAILNATLDAGKEALARHDLGTLTAKERMEALTTQVANLKLEMGQGLLRVGAGAAGTFQSIAAGAIEAYAGVARLLQGWNELRNLMSWGDVAAEFRRRAQEWKNEAETAAGAAAELAGKAHDNFALMFAPKDDLASATAPRRSPDREGDDAPSKKLEDLRKKWAKAAQELRDEMATSGMEGLDKQIYDIAAKTRDLIKEYGKLPGATALIREWGDALEDVARKEQSRASHAAGAEETAREMEAEGEAVRQRRQAMQALERSLTETQASELDKRLAQVDEAAKHQVELAMQAYDLSTLEGVRAWADRETAILQSASEKKKKIRAEEGKAIREAEIQRQLAELDIAEAGGAARRQTISDRIRLQEEMLALQEAGLMAISKEQDPTGWYAQARAIDETRKALAGLTREADLHNPFAAIARGLNDVANEAADTGKRLYDAVTRAFDGMTDALTDSVMTMKLNYRDLADSIIRDLIRIQIQQSITGPLAAVGGNWLKGLFAPAATGLGGISGGMATSGGYAGGSYAGAHGGGEVGKPAAFYRFVANPELIPRRHGGGLAPDERMTINRVGERYVTAEQNEWLTGLAGAFKALGGLARTNGAAAPAVTVNIHNHNDSEIAQETRETPGGIEIDVMIDAAVARKMSTFGTRSNRALRQSFGARERLVAR
jgi:lambda family phage tail tape measure protein